LAATSRIRLLYLAHFSKPTADRVLYRAIRRYKPRKILEFGLGTAQRATRMIQLAALERPASEVHYVAIDPFETRSTPDAAVLSIKDAYRALAKTGARVRLCPGDPYLALSRAANSLGQADLVVISSNVDQASLDRAWFYLPRMLHASTQVFLQQQGAPEEPGPFQLVSRAEIDSRATAAFRRRAA